MPITGNSRGFGQRDGSAAQWIRCGEALAAAKEQVPHGEWLPWLEANFEGSERTAQAYATVAANPQRAADLDTSNLSLRAVLKRIERINREEKKLPDGFLDGLVEATGKSRRELKYRRQFAERYPTAEGIGQCIAQSPSWFQIVNGVLGSGASVSENAGDNEWYTPPEYIEAAVAVMGAIDLDPASTAAANEIVSAQAFYSAEDNGLEQDWRGRVWMNPPYDGKLIFPFCEKLAEAYAEGDVSEAIVLVNNGTETAWFQRLGEVASALGFPTRRVKFWHPEKESAPLQGQAVIYLGANVEAFRREFVRFGMTAVL